ncbi:alpha/beta fold hydrolase [Microbacterium sp. GXF6406]
MLLNAVETGTGDDVVLLLHGLMGSGESWERIADLLAERGRRVIALDLPGHGRSPRDPAQTIASAADAVVETVSKIAPGKVRSAIGHSYGATVLSAASGRLSLAHAVYVDSTCEFGGGADREAFIAQYAADRARRSDAAWLRSSRPFYRDRDATVEASAARDFDPETAANLSCGADVSHPPGSGDILVCADPSAFVTEADAERMRARGVDVRSIPGAAHTVWYSHFDEFVGALPEVFIPG